MAEKYSIVYMHHIFFIHSSVDGCLGYLHVLAIVNSAAVNIGMQWRIWIQVALLWSELCAIRYFTYVLWK